MAQAAAGWRSGLAQPAGAAGQDRETYSEGLTRRAQAQQGSDASTPAQTRPVGQPTMTMSMEAPPLQPGGGSARASRLESRPDGDAGSDASVTLMTVI